jgi:hypothetical protein
MKLKDVMKIENLGKKYRCGGNNIWVLENFFGDDSTCGLDLKDDKSGDSITENYFLGKILELDFEEVVEIDWKNIPIDTPLLVKNDSKKAWRKRHFAKYEDGKVYCFSHGTTSFSGDKDCVTSWKIAKLFKEEGGEN